MQDIHSVHALPSQALCIQGRKPKGYWDRPANMQEEIDKFCKEHNLPQGIIPLTMDFKRAKRFDLTHAIERWGGPREVADMLNYEVCAAHFCYAYIISHHRMLIIISHSCMLVMRRLLHPLLCMDRPL